MARAVFSVVFVIVCTVSVSLEQDWEAIQRDNDGKVLDSESIRQKGRMLLTRFRQRSSDMISMKIGEWNSAGQLENNNFIVERYRYVEKEAIYEIKQRLVDAIAGEAPQIDPEIPRQSEALTSLFMEAVFADSYEKQSSREESMMQILRDILEEKQEY